MIARLLQKTAQYLSIMGLLSLSLLLFALGYSALMLSGFIKGFEGFHSLLAVFLGISTGWILASTKKNFIKSTLIALLTSFLWAVFVLGQLVRPLAVLFSRFGYAYLAAWRWILVRESLPPDLVPIQLAMQEAANHLIALGSRLFAWLTRVLTGESYFDPLIVLMVWSFLFTLISAWGSWFVRRRWQGLFAVLPSGLLLAGMVNYVGEEANSLLPFLFASLFLMITASQAGREFYWEDSRLDYSTDIRIDIATITIPITITLLVIGSFWPIISIQRMLELAQSIGEKPAERVEQVGGAFGIDAPAQPAELEPAYLTEKLPRSHLLGAGPDLTTDAVMEVSVENLAVTITEDGQVSVPNYYWRSLSYDVYTRHGWATSPFNISAYEGGDPIQSIDETTSGQTTLRQHIVKLVPGNPAVYHTGDLITTDQDFEISRRSLSQSEFDLLGASTDALEYSVDSHLRKTSPGELRQAGRDYPAWVEDLYLRLPEDIPHRVTTLAIEITAGKANVYDQTAAIEAYLRQYPYNLDIEEPPPNRDVVDYFLYDLQQGFCDYYATSMVVMARSVGIPSRFVTGYSTGSYDLEKGKYIVSGKNSHAWVEVYFPGYGWVEFDPTAGMPGFQRADEAPALASTVKIPAGRSLMIRGVWRLVGLASVGFFGLLLLLADGWNRVDTRRLLQMEPSAAVDRLYERFRRRSARLERTHRQDLTPNEFASSLDSVLKSISIKNKPWSYLEQTNLEVSRITELYSRASYSAHPLNKEESRSAVENWQRLRWRLLLARLLTLGKNRPKLRV